MSRHRLVDAPRSDALLIAVLVGGLAALGAGAYWAIKVTIDHQKAEDAQRAAAAPARTKPVDQPVAAPTPEPVADEPPPEPEPEREPEPEAEPEPEIEGGCELDEVACILESEPPACCQIYKNRNRDRTGEPLGTDDIRAVVNAAKSAIADCAEKTPFEGVVRAAVKVQPSGRVDKVTLDGDPPSRLARCMTGVIKKLKFRRTKQGGSFRYPFKFSG